MVKKMKVEELKSYLRLRALKVTGKKDELVARVFAAMENNVRPVKTAEEVEREIQAEYANKLQLVDEHLPDPFLVTDNWLSEEDGLIYWPMVLYPDIFNYLSFNPSELGSKDLSDYKSCKAYSYYKCGWLQAIQYNKIDESSKYCMMKTDCRKSERINDTFHKLWVILAKKTGKIVSAHCTCMAGLSQTCNHVAAALFRIEAAVRLGLTNPACTSSSSEWLPNRQEVIPSKIKDISFDRDDFAQRGKKKRTLVPSPRKNYNPLANSNLKLLSLTDIAKAVSNVAPSSILMSAVPKPKIDFFKEVISKNTTPTVASIDDILLMSSKNEFLETMISNMNETNLKEIEILTRGQSDNDAWFNYRKGVITASKAHEVLTKMEKMESMRAANMWSLNQNISGFRFTNLDLPALKYGRTMEVNAVNCFLELMRKDHRNLKVDNCGLFLHNGIPYIGGSPDGIVCCDCCGRACLEIKCPFSINFTSPTNPEVKSKLPYLLLDPNGSLKINKKHKYFTQCQVQMGVTNITKSYFMVWTPHGYILDVISFDTELWMNMERKFCKYYEDIYLNSIFYSESSSKGN